MMTSKSRCEEHNREPPPPPHSSNGQFKFILLTSQRLRNEICLFFFLLFFKNFFLFSLSLRRVTPVWSALSDHLASKERRETGVCPGPKVLPVARATVWVIDVSVPLQVCGACFPPRLPPFLGHLCSRAAAPATCWWLEGGGWGGVG